MRVYLAGPEVFLPDAATVGERKKAICAAHGLTGVFPLDEADAGSSDPRMVYEHCLALLGSCDGVIANLTPFRSISADPGTAFELGYMAGRGKPVFGYTNAQGSLLERLRDGAELSSEPGPPRTPDGCAVEDFDLFDNLMLPEALLATGIGIVAPDGPVSDPLRDHQAFKRCVALAASHLAGPSPGQTSDTEK